MPVDNKYTFQIIGTDKTAKAFKSLNASIRKTVNVAGAMGAGVAAGLAVMVTKSLEANTEMTRLAESVGVGSQALSEWSFAAKTVNLESEKMADIFKDVQDKIGDFAITGGGGAADMFEKLNLDVKDFIGLQPDKQLIKIGEALDGVQTQSEKIFFLEALAGDASRLLPLLENNAEGLKELSAEAQALGVSVTDIDAAKMEAAQRSIEKAQASAAGFANKVAVQLAPIIEVVSEKLIAAGRDGDGLGKAIKKGFELGAKAAGVFADGVRGVKVVFKGLEVLARGLNFVLIGGFIKLVEVINDISNALIDGIAFPIREILKLAAPFSDLAQDALNSVDSLVSKIKVETPAAMHAFVDAQAEAFDVARGELHALLMEDLPSTVIKANIERVLAEAEAKAVERVKESRAKIAAGLGSGEDLGVEDPRIVKEREALAARLRRLDESHLTELQKLQVKFADELQIIQLAEDQKLLLEDSANAKRLRATEAFEKAKIDLAKKSGSITSNLLKGGMLFAQAFMNSGSRKLFKLQQRLALAQASVAVPAAVTESYKNAGGYPLGIPAAVAMAAKGAAEIASIKSQSLGSAGGGSVAGGGGVGTPALSSPVASDIQSLGSQLSARDAAAAESRRPIVQFNITGDVIGDKAETLLAELRELIEGSDAVLFSANSRQAQELVPG